MGDKLVNVELFSLTYGALVRTIVKDTVSTEEANTKLAKIGSSIGRRIADDVAVLYPSLCRVKSLKAASELVAEVIKTHLGIPCTLVESSDQRSVLRLLDCPITRYVVIPPELEGLVYLQPLVHAIISMLELLHVGVDVALAADRLTGSQYTDVELKHFEIKHDDLPPGEYLS
jgi:hypothetical protein